MFTPGHVTAAVWVGPSLIFGFPGPQSGVPHFWVTPGLEIRVLEPTPTLYPTPGWASRAAGAGRGLEWVLAGEGRSGEGWGVGILEACS